MWRQAWPIAALPACPCCLGRHSTATRNYPHHSKAEPPAASPDPPRAQELQQQNSRLLVVNRQLAEEAETTRTEAEAAVRAEYDAALSALREELAELAERRKGAEEMLAAVARQRDTLRELLTGTGGDLGAARSAYAQTLPVTPRPQQAAQQPIGGEGAGPESTAASAAANLRALHADMEQQLKAFKEETQRTQQLLSEDVSAVQLSAELCMQPTAPVPPPRIPCPAAPGRLTSAVCPVRAADARP